VETPDLLFAVAVLDTASASETDAIREAREAIAARYRELRQSHGFTDGYRMAAAEWLRAYLAGDAG
jgi:hypothetical protein